MCATDQPTDRSRMATNGLRWPFANTSRAALQWGKICSGILGPLVRNQAQLVAHHVCLIAQQQMSIRKTVQFCVTNRSPIHSLQKITAYQKKQNLFCNGLGKAWEGKESNLEGRTMNVLSKNRGGAIPDTRLKLDKKWESSFTALARTTVLLV